MAEKRSRRRNIIAMLSTFGARSESVQLYVLRENSQHTPTTV
jgi:hypothetical protein